MCLGLHDFENAVKPWLTLQHNCGGNTSHNRSSLCNERGGAAAGLSGAPDGRGVGKPAALVGVAGLPTLRSAGAAIGSRARAARLVLRAARPYAVAAPVVARL